MHNTMTSANTPIEEDKENAATATASNSETTTGDTEDTQKQPTKPSRTSREHQRILVLTGRHRHASGNACRRRTCVALKS